ncbi:hypothetical protein ETC00_18980, partial [Brevibacillus sp. MCWH]|nr:hypothetical protein [Brevibacillus sp. MCWH]
MSNVKDIRCGGHHTFFILNDGSVRGCGRNDYGQLGIGNTTDQTSIVNIPISNVKDIVCGWNHTFFVLNDGTARGCGRNMEGQLFYKTTITLSPIQIKLYDKKYSIKNGRKVVSDRQVSEKRTILVNPFRKNKKFIRTIQSVKGKWSVNDKIEIYANDGIVSGVFDEDTQLAIYRGVSTTFTSGTPIRLNDVSKLSVNDSVRLVKKDLTTLPASGSYTVTSVDTTNKTITLNQTVSLSNGEYFVETTSSSSLPVVTATGIAGTWEGLGTSKATFTITTVPNPDTATIKIEYSVSYPSYQGIKYLPKNVLGGFINNNPLEVTGNGLVTVTDNFAYKHDTGSSVKHVARFRTNIGTVQTPNNVTSLFNQDQYNKISNISSSNLNISTSSSGNIAQATFQFNLFDTLERKFGLEFFDDCLNDTEKRTKLINYISEFSVDLYGFGTG